MRAVLAEMIAPPTGDCVLVAGEGALCVHADLTRQAWAGMGHTLVYIYYKKCGLVLNAHPKYELPFACHQCSKVKVHVHMVSELTGAAASSILDITRWARGRCGALEGARCVDAELVNPTIMGSQNAFINVCNRQRRKIIRAHFFPHPGSEKPPHFSC